ncbi:cyclic-phosphate processing receiver domain-containing protein [Aquisphaera insulae]|uniref:cyclic-phosphate processing receiver domain-containing protein n=1 Tax=Aquisphaera insulae TaxID=2712864 RepID=UPI0013ED6DB0|nr:cyclic-phosphate processing receiver domain-containing protein [Aquisphaera insulae]
MTRMGIDSPPRPEPNSPTSAESSRECDAVPHAARLLFLDDDPRRTRSFLEINPHAVAVSTAEACVSRLEDPWDEVHLDHDLGGEVYVDSGRSDCGMEVVRWIVSRPAGQFHDTLFVIHTHNVKAAGVMCRALREHGLAVVYRPFGINVDEWIEELAASEPECPTPALRLRSWPERLAAIVRRVAGWSSRRRSGELPPEG